MKKKKLIVIITLTFFIFTSMFVGPQQKAEAFAPAIPIIAGGVLLGALGLAAVADFAGADVVADDLNSFGEKTKQFITDSSVAIATGATAWIIKESVDDPPDLHFDYSGVDEAGLSELQNVTSNTVNTYAADSIGKADAKTTYGNYEYTPHSSVDPFQLDTAYPDFHLYAYGSSKIEMGFTSTFDINDSNSRIFMISNKGEIYFTTRFYIMNTSGMVLYIDSSIPGYQLSKGFKDLGSVSTGMSMSREVYLYNLADVALYPTAETFIPKMIDSIHAKGGNDFSITITTVDAMMNLYNSMYQNTIDQSIEKWKATGITINGQAILEANPTITWDGTSQNWVEKDTGTVVDPTTLNMPNVGVYDGTVAVPVGDTYAPVDTGVIAGEGAGTGTGTDTGDTGGILTGLWDFLKGILQAILDAINAVVDYVKNLTLISTIVTWLQDLEIPNPIEAIESIGIAIGGFWQDVGTWFGDVIKAIPNPIDAITTGFGEVIGAVETGFDYVNPLSENFFLTLAFVPAEGFMSDFFNGLQTEFNVKIPIFHDLTDFFSTITGITFSTKIPEFKVTLPDSLGGGTYSIIDFGFFTDYRSIVVNFIRFTAWFMFLKKLYNRIPKMIY